MSDIKKLLRSRCEYEAERKMLVKCAPSKHTKRRIKELEQKIAEADSLILSIPDDTLRLVLVCKYIQGHSDEKISDEINYSPRHVRRLHRRALEYLENKK